MEEKIFKNSLFLTGGRWKLALECGVVHQKEKGLLRLKWLLKFYFNCMLPHAELHVASKYLTPCLPFMMWTTWIFSRSQSLHGSDFTTVWTIQMYYTGWGGFPSCLMRWLSFCSWVSVTLIEVPVHPCDQQLFLEWCLGLSRLSYLAGKAIKKIKAALITRFLFERLLTKKLQLRIGNCSI